MFIILIYFNRNAYRNKLYLKFAQKYKISWPNMTFKPRQPNLEKF
ncbi:hypothetical protein HMPREF0766_13564 [Sphingobacterium spiritivorum ATCC 33861]|uniref:Uncharacterized protein n=1 Tax=Sphingobacterium spiritivorum ATCC 33861 TaxID=525373 RepID=D7VRG0_SPHSI|nr:hypothetical protein HMPREF0766_13564 [Sphingobacterium spiritivorum ATCC 33861]